VILKVSCAITYHEGKILIAQRKPGVHLAGFWEFPGGKCEKGETMEACLVREVQEELSVEIRPRILLRQEDHEYPDKTVSLYFYLCDWVSGSPVKKDCQDFKWILPEELKNFRFPPADTLMIDDLIRQKDILFPVKPK